MTRSNSKKELIRVLPITPIIAYDAEGTVLEELTISCRRQSQGGRTSLPVGKQEGGSYSAGTGGDGKI